MYSIQKQQAEGHHKKEGGRRALSSSKGMTARSASGLGSD